MQYSAGLLVLGCVILEDKGSQAQEEHTSGSDREVLGVDLDLNSTSQRPCIF